MNPKEGEGAKKVAMHLIPESGLIQAAQVFQHSAEHRQPAYPPFNWRESPVKASTYVGAIRRHLAAWVDGEDNDESTGLSHWSHMLANCLLFCDALNCEMVEDDRPPAAPTGELIRQATRRDE